MITAFVLKIIASIFMFIDHIGAVFPEYTPELFRWIGRIALPIYAYMIAQGCVYTKNINKYLLRLGIFALISEIPFDIAFMHYNTGDNIINLNINFLRNTNVFYTLFLGVACIAIYEKLKIKKRPWLALLLILFLPVILLVDSIPDTFPVSGMNMAAIVMGLYTAGALFFANFLPDDENGIGITFKKKIIPFLVALPLFMTSVSFLQADKHNF